MKQVKLKGIDISSWQSDLYLHRLKTKPDFAIVRIGGSDGKTGIYEDSRWRLFYMQSKILDIPVGAYWFATGNIPMQAQVNKCLELMADTKCELPFFLDVEHDTLLKKPKNDLSIWIKDFLSAMENAGYYCGLYASASTWHYNLTKNYVSRFDSWPAIWNGKKPEDEGVSEYIMHQIGTETWSGYAKPLDTNYLYKDVMSVITEKHFNNWKE